MNAKRIAALALACALVLISAAAVAAVRVPVAYAAPDAQDMTEQAAIEAARAAVAEAFDVTEEALASRHTYGTLVQADGEKVWVVSFEGPLWAEYAAVIRATDGEALDVRDEDAARYYRRQWEAELGPAGRWTIEEKEIFWRMFERGLIETHHPMLPDETVIPQAEALALAKAHIAEETDVEPDALDTMLVAAFYEASQLADVETEWAFQLWDPDYLEKEIDYPLYQVILAAEDGRVLMFSDQVTDGPGAG